jgi:hypothetical protein
MDTDDGMADIDAESRDIDNEQMKGEGEESY